MAPWKVRDLVRGTHVKRSHNGMTGTAEADGRAATRAVMTQAAARPPTSAEAVGANDRCLPRERRNFSFRLAQTSMASETSSKRGSQSRSA